MYLTPSPCFVAFHINSASRFEALRAAYAAIKHDKETDTWRDDEDWLALFDDEALAHFWWPTKEEKEAHRRRWESAPIPERLYDPELEPPSWDFLAMIEVFKDGEYDLLDCRRVEDDQGRLEFEPHSWPYGGTGCMQMLVRAFGFEVTGEDDGTGYRRLCGSDSPALHCAAPQAMLSGTLAPRRASFALNERKYCSVTVDILVQLLLCHGRDAFHARTLEAQCGTEAILTGTCRKNWGVRSDVGLLRVRTQSAGFLRCAFT